MKARHTDGQHYVGLLVHPEEETELWLRAEITGSRYKNGEWYDTRKWSTTVENTRAFRLPVDDYTAGKARALFKVTKDSKHYMKRGYLLHVVLVTCVREMMSVGENASPLVQLAMLAPDDDS